MQFLAEALLLSFLGGCVGCVIGAAVTWGMCCLAYGWPVTIAWYVKPGASSW